MPGAGGVGWGESSVFKYFAGPEPHQGVWGQDSLELPFGKLTQAVTQLDVGLGLGSGLGLPFSIALSAYASVATVES